MVGSKRDSALARRDSRGELHAFVDPETDRYREVAATREEDTREPKDRRVGGTPGFR